MSELRRQFNKFWWFLFIAMNGFMAYFYPHTVNENAQKVAQLAEQAAQATEHSEKLAASEMLGTAQTASAITESAMRWGWAILALVFLLMIFLTRNKKH